MIMIPQKPANKLSIAWQLFLYAVLFFLIPVFFLAYTEKMAPSWWNANDLYVKYGSQALLGIFSGVSASLFFVGVLKYFNNDDKYFKPEIEFIYGFMRDLEKTFSGKCAALKDSQFYVDIRFTSDLIKENKVEPILTKDYHTRLTQERNVYKNSNHILTLSFDLLHGYYSDKSPGLDRLLEEKILQNHYVIRRIVIVENDMTRSKELNTFIRNFEDCGWRIISREDLTNNQKISMFRDFAIFCNQDNEPKKAYFTYVNGSMENLFTKTSWAPYCTSNKEYIENLHDRFEKLWNEEYVKHNTIKTWLKNTSSS